MRHGVVRTHIVIDATGGCVREVVLLMRQADARLRSKATTIPATASCKFGARHEVKLSQILLKLSHYSHTRSTTSPFPIIKMKNPTYGALVGLSRFMFYWILITEPCVSMYLLVTYFTSYSEFLFAHAFSFARLPTSRFARVV